MRKTAGLLAAISLILSTTTAFGAAQDHQPATKSKPVAAPPWKAAIVTGTVNVNDGSKTQPVTYIRVNTHNPHVIVETALADNRLGHTATLAGLAQSKHAIAAINGGFFRDYSDNMPESTVMTNGQYAHLWGPTILGVGNDGSLKMFRGQEALYIAFDHDWTNIHAWGLNSWSGQSGEIDVMTPFYGSSTRTTNATAVVVQNGVVTAIHRGDTPIPVHGFVVVFGDGSSWLQRIVSDLRVGEPASMKVVMTDLSGTNTLPIDNLRCAIGAGPLLVDGGRIALNPTLEHLTDASLLNPVTRRSFVGIDANGNLVLATVKFANVAQLARIAHNMHLREAMNLDGGSSSGLYFNGKYLLAPGRKLSDALTVSYR
jgi:exopolysaccharide biosynthesis protein